MGQFTLSVSWPKPGYASITCSTISNIPYNLIFTIKFNDSSILITIISCDYLNLSLADEHVGDVRLSSITKIFSRQISQSDWNIQIKLNYYILHKLIWRYFFSFVHKEKQNFFHNKFGFLWILRFPTPIKLTATIKLKYCWKWC